VRCKTEQDETSTSRGLAGRCSVGSDSALRLWTMSHSEADASFMASNVMLLQYHHLPCAIQRMDYDSSGSKTGVVSEENVRSVAN
jgi:hypothetical protein